jgi:hypothetical protein
MTPVVVLFLLLAAPAASTLDQVKSEPNAERRARAAIDFATTEERNVEAAYANGDLEQVRSGLKIVAESIEMARESLVASHKTPGRNPGLYKYGEQRSNELLVRLGDLEKRMDESERQMVAAPKAKIQEIHDDWFEGIMNRKK